MIDVQETLAQAQGLLRKLSHALGHEVSRRLLVDIDSLIDSIRIVELEQKQRDNPRQHD